MLGWLPWLFGQSKALQGPLACGVSTLSLINPPEIVGFQPRLAVSMLENCDCSSQHHRAIAALYCSSFFRRAARTRMSRGSARLCLVTLSISTTRRTREVSPERASRILGLRKEARHSKRFSRSENITERDVDSEAGVAGLCYISCD